MTTGWTTTGVLADSVDTIVAAARTTREYRNVAPQLISKHNLAPNTDDSYKEVLLAQMNAQAITENTKNENPQLYSDSFFEITPQMVQIATFVPDKVGRTLSRKTLAVMGKVPGEAMARKQDEDVLTAMDGSTINLGTANTPLITGDVASARYQITSNATEPGPMPINSVFHGFQLKDFFDELTAFVGTDAMPAGPSAQVFRRGYTLPIAQVNVHEDGNISIDANDDAKAFVFSREAWILVQHMTIKHEIERKPGWGGGGDLLFLTGDWAIGERSAGNWSAELIGDASTPS